MTIITDATKSLYPVYKVNEENPLKELFKLAEAGDWDEVYNIVAVNPQLLNATLDEGPDAGKTVLLIAASKVDKYSQEGEDQAFSFIKKLIELDFDFNLDAALLSGESVMWFMTKNMFCFVDGIDVDKDQNRDILNEGPVIIIQLLKKYPDLNINSAPSTGSHKGITLFLLLILGNHEGEYSDAMIDIVANTRQKISYSLYSCECFNMDTLIGLTRLIWANFQRIKVGYDYDLNKIKIYDQLFNMIELNPHAANIEIRIEGDHIIPPNKALEIALSNPSSPERNKLVVYLILSGAEPSKQASQVRKEEFEVIKNKLESIIKSAYTVGLYQNLTVEEHLRLLPEIRWNIAFKMIWSEYPELLNFPFEGLKNKLFKSGKD